MYLTTILVSADFTRLRYSKLDAVNIHWGSYVEYHDSLNEFVRRREEGEPLSSIVGCLTLSYVLMVPTMMLEDTRPEDKIYGLYEVCKRLGFELPKPDYKKSPGHRIHGSSTGDTPLRLGSRDSRVASASPLGGSWEFRPGCPTFLGQRVSGYRRTRRICQLPSEQNHSSLG